MTHRLNRRSLLKAGAAAALPLLPPQARAQERRFQPEIGTWRSFELTTTVNVAEVKGATQLWLPVPDVATDWQQPLDNAWTGNTRSALSTTDSTFGHPNRNHERYKNGRPIGNELTAIGGSKPFVGR